MVRPFLSLLVASVATACGLAILLTAGQRHLINLAQGSTAPDAGLDALVVLGAVILGIAAASLALHWVGALVVGAVHLLLGGIAVLIPITGPLSGAYSPTWEISGMLRDLDQALGDGSTLFFFSGAAFVLGAFLIGAALGVRSRWDSPPADRPTAAISSTVGGVVLVLAVVVLATAGDQFVTTFFVQLRYDFALALVVAVAALLAGIGGLTLRWSSAGVLAVGLVVVVVGTVFVVAGSELPGQVVRAKVVSCGLVPALGMSFVAAAIAGMVRRPSVPADAVAL